MDENLEIDKKVKPGVRAITYDKNIIPNFKRKKPKVRTRKLTNDKVEKASKNNDNISYDLNLINTFVKNPPEKTKRNIRVRKYGTKTEIRRKKTDDNVSDLQKSTDLAKIKLKPAKVKVNEPLDSIPLEIKEEKFEISKSDDRLYAIKEKRENYEFKNVVKNKNNKQIDKNNIINVIYPMKIENKVDNINIYNEINQPITVQNTYIENVIQNNLKPVYQTSQQTNYIENYIPTVPLQTNDISTINNVNNNIISSINTVSNNDINNDINNIINNNAISNNILPVQTNKNIQTTYTNNYQKLQKSQNEAIYSNNYQKLQKSQNVEISNYYNRLKTRKLLKNNNNIYNSTQIYNISPQPQILYNNNMSPTAPSAKIITPSKIYNSFKVSIDPPEKFNLTEFEPVKLIGQGGFAYIYNVRWKKNGKNYALKKCISQQIEDLKIERKQARVLMNFVNSTGCDGVVKIYGEIINKANNTQYILMELLDLDWGKEIDFRKNLLKYYTEIELMKILSQLIKTCSLLEKYSIAHRDIKPENVLITKEGKYKLCDFSDSIVCSKGKLKQLVRGTELFMSPLLVTAYHNGDYAYHDCFKSDVYSLGFCILMAATLDVKYILEFRTLIDSQSKMTYLTRLLGNRFSKKFINLIFWMVQNDEMKRPYFEQLEQMMSGY